MRGSEGQRWASDGVTLDLHLYFYHYRAYYLLTMKKALVARLTYWATAAAALTVCGERPAVARDWQTAPAIVQSDTTEDIYAIGDVHADEARLRTLLQAAGLWRANAWSGQRATLVLLGDMIDKGPSSLGALRFILNVQRQAASAGGQVIAVMGNHEAEFLAHPRAAKAAEFAKELQSAGLSPEQTAAGENDIGRFLTQLPFGARVRNWFFSHGGNTHGRTLADLSSALQQGVQKDGFASDELLDENSLLEARLGAKGKNGRPWFEEGGGAEKVLTRNARALGVEHLVQGHQPGKVEFPDGAIRQPGELFQWRGLLFLADTGLSSGVDNSNGAVLWIQGDRAVGICADGKRSMLWGKDAPAVSRVPVCR